VLAQRLPGAPLGVIEQFPHGQIDGLRRMFAVAPRQRDLAAEEGMFLILAQIDGADVLGHAPARHHRARQARRLADVVVGARAQRAQQGLLRVAAAEDDGQPVAQIVLVDGVAFLLGQLMGTAQRAAAGRAG